MVAEPPGTRHEVEAALGARRELGPLYEDEIAAGLADRVEQLAALRVGELRYEAELRRDQRADDRGARTQSFVLGIVSLGAGIPVSAISAELAHVPGLLIAWAGIVGVNLAHAWSRRRTR